VSEERFGSWIRESEASRGDCEGDACALFNTLFFIIVIDFFIYV
jgi:hypothetical protein